MTEKVLKSSLLTYSRNMERQVISAKNIYTTPAGTLHPMPFNVGWGLWFFDGQIFYRLGKKK